MTISEIIEIDKGEIHREAMKEFERLHWSTNSVDEPSERALMKMKWFIWGYLVGCRNTKKGRNNGN